MRTASSCKLLSLAILGVLAISVMPSQPVVAQASAQARSQIAQAYAAVLVAQQSGGNVSILVGKLNSALRLVQEADMVNATNPARAQSLYSQALSLALQVSQAAPDIVSSGRSAVLAARFELAIETAILAAIAILAYLFTPRLYWRSWLRAHRGWRAKKA
jgi:hypothetical protein